MHWHKQFTCKISIVPLAAKPETTFYRSVHKLLPEVYKEKMYNPLRGGTPDVWYSGNANDLWVEYKWLAKVPKKAPIRMYKLLSPLQLMWLERRQKEGRNVAVVLGTPEGAWIFQSQSWEIDLDPIHLRGCKYTKHHVADYIRGKVCLHVEVPATGSQDDKSDV
jgi:hypothetical protein